MKIRELIEKLKKFDQEKYIACYCEDEGLIAEGEPIQIFEINDVSESYAESRRLDDGRGKPWLKFGKTDKSSKFVLIEITSDA